MLDLCGALAETAMELGQLDSQPRLMGAAAPLSRVTRGVENLNVKVRGELGTWRKCWGF